MSGKRILRPLIQRSTRHERPASVSPSLRRWGMKKAYWIHGRLLTERDLHDIRAQLEGFTRVEAISDEMRDVIETEWPDLAAEIAAAQRRGRTRVKETPGFGRVIFPGASAGGEGCGDVPAGDSTTELA